jgi:hypothetical protein
MQSQFGILIIIVGIVLAVVGIPAYFGGLTWFGNLPGDINIGGENTRIYMPRIGWKSKREASFKKLI